VEIRKIFSLSACVLGFLIPITFWEFFRVTENVPRVALDYFIENTIYWLVPSVALWSSSVVLWGDKNRYWVMWILIGLSTLFLIYVSVVLFLVRNMP
jgi:hypothetical protein